MYLSQLFLAKSVESTGGSFAIRHCDSSNLYVPLPPSLTWNPKISPSKGMNQTLESIIFRYTLVV